MLPMQPRSRPSRVRVTKLARRAVSVGGGRLGRPRAGVSGEAERPRRGQGRDRDLGPVELGGGQWREAPVAERRLPGIVGHVRQQRAVRRHAADAAAQSSVEGQGDEAGPPSGERRRQAAAEPDGRGARSEENTSELQTLMRSSYAVFCLKKKNITLIQHNVLTTISIS